MIKIALVLLAGVSVFGCKTTEVTKSEVKGNTEEDPFTFRVFNELCNPNQQFLKPTSETLKFGDTWSCTWNDTVEGNFVKKSFSTIANVDQRSNLFFSSNDANVGLSGTFSTSAEGTVYQQTSKARLGVIGDWLKVVHIPVQSDGSKKMYFVEVESTADINHTVLRRHGLNSYCSDRTRVMLAIGECTLASSECVPTATADLECPAGTFASNDNCLADSPSNSLHYAQCITGPKECFDMRIISSPCASPTHVGCPGSSFNIQCK
jgi:hypothetical protein